MHRYIAEVRGAISMDIPVSVLFEGWQWAMSSYKTGHTKLVTNWKCQNKISTLTLSTQSQDMNPIENLWLIKYDLGDIVQRHPIDNLTQVDRVFHGRLQPGSQPRFSSSCPLNANTMLKKQWAKAVPKYTNPSSQRKSGLWWSLNDEEGSYL